MELSLSCINPLVQNVYALPDFDDGLALFQDRR